MNKRMTKKDETTATASSLDDLLGLLRAIIQDARRHAPRAADAVQVHTCWEVGRHIFEFERDGADHAGYGARLLNLLAERLTDDFDRGFAFCIFVTCGCSTRHSQIVTRCVTN